jgi:hypothetical protein
MPAQKNSADVELSIFGGLCTEIQPSDLPQGASPLTYDTDFDVGQVRTRDGLQSAYTLVANNAMLYESGPGLQNFMELEDGSGIMLLES